MNHLELVDQRSDYFALAVTCWLALMGRIPLLNANPSLTTNLQLTHPLPDLDSIYKAFQEPLQKLGAKHHFRLPPNRMPKEKVNEALREGMNQRYEDLQEFIQDVEENLKNARKRWGLF